MSTKRLRFVAFALPGLLALAFAADGCSADKETLIVVSMTAEPAAPGLTSSTITAAAVQKVFVLANGLSANATQVGVFVPASVTGQVEVTVVATGGGLCYRGTKTTTITSAGTQANVAITLTPAATCPAGTAGEGGGTAGAGAAGASGAAGAGTAGGVGAAGSGTAGAGTAGATGAAGAGTAGATGAAGAGTAGATGAAGAAGAAAYKWSVGENISHNPLVSSQWPHVAIDASHGNVLVSFVQDPFPAVMRYDAQKKMWSTPKVLDNRGEVYETNVAMDDAGHAVVVWLQNDNKSPPVDLKGAWFAHSEDGGVTWSAPARIYAGRPWGDLVLGMASNGTARVAWDESDGTTRSLWSASYDPTTKTFSAAALVKLGSDVFERHARLAVAPGGRGLLVWIQRDGAGKDSVWGSSFATPTGALTTPVLVDSYTGNDNASQSVSISPDGMRGIVAWEERGASDSEDIWTSDWTVAGGFAAEKLAETGASLGAPAVAIDSAYTVTMAYSLRTNSNKWQVVSTRRPDGQPWGTTVPLESTNQAGDFTDEIAYSTIACDAAGNVHVLWRRKLHPVRADPTFSVVVRRYAKATATWEPELTLGMKEGMPAFDYPIAVAADGRAAAVFFYRDPNGVGGDEAYNTFAALYK